MMLRGMFRRQFFSGSSNLASFLSHWRTNIIFCSNGKTGEILSERSSVATEPRYRGQRVRRTRLHAALLARVPKDIIKLRKRLVTVTELAEGGVRLDFEDGEEIEADLVVGGDGIRSVFSPFHFISELTFYNQKVREFVFPEHTIKFTGLFTPPSILLLLLKLSQAEQSGGLSSPNPSSSISPEWPPPLPGGTAPQAISTIASLTIPAQLPKRSKCSR